jgi:hypothetical protein
MTFTVTLETVKILWPILAASAGIASGLIVWMTYVILYLRTISEEVSSNRRIVLNHEHRNADGLMSGPVSFVATAFNLKVPPPEVP